MALSTINATTGLTDGTVTSAKLADFAAAVDLNGVELILDADQDTSITADTDDRIDFKIAGVEHFSFSNSSGDTIIKPMVDAKDIKLQQFDGRTLLDINDAGFVGIENGATGPGVIRIFEDSDLGSNYVGLSVGNVSTAYTLVFPNADGSSGQALTTNGSGVLSFSTISTALDDLAAGDAAVTLTTSSGNITIDAAANDSDIIFKGTDGGADKTFATFDGSAGGDLFLNGGLIDLKNDGSNVSQIKFYCESSNAHAQTLIGAPHAQAADNTLTLPDGADGVLLSTTSTATVTNKTLTSPVINTGTFGTSILPTSADGTTLGSASKEFSDLFLADASTIQFGADQDVILTHVADTGLLLSGTNVIQFNDASQNIGAPSNAILDINATDEIELNATLVDINANVEISGTATTTGVHTFTAVPVFPNNTIETADIQDNAITLAKLAGGTDGNIISFDASGDPVAVATGSDGQVLTSTGAGSPPAFETLPTGDMVLLSTVSAPSGTAAVVFNSSVMTSTYKDFYLIIKRNFVETDEATVGLYFSHDNGSSFAGTVRKSQIFQQLNGTGTGKENANTTGFVQLGSAHSDGTSGGSGNIFLNGLGYTGYKYINYLYTHRAASDPYAYQGSAELQNTAVINYIKLEASTGDIKGYYSLYGVKN